MTITETSNLQTNALEALDTESDETTTDTSSSTSTSSATQETFLQLLVAQLKNQNPLDPADGTEFVAELAQFSELEQTIAMRQDLDILASAESE